MSQVLEPICYRWREDKIDLKTGKARGVIPRFEDGRAFLDPKATLEYRNDIEKRVGRQLIEYMLERERELVH
jgi:hypothetical protein